MAIDRDTTLGEIKGFYRTVIVAAFKTYRKALKKAQKSEEEIDGDTSHIDERAEICAEFEAALDARVVRSMADTPIGRAIVEGESRVIGIQADEAQTDFVDVLAPGAGVDLMDNATMIAVLDAVGYRSKPDEIHRAVSQWDSAQRRDVFRWSMAMQLVGKPGVYVKVPERPAIVSLDWLDSVMLELVASGDVDPETLKEPEGMSEAEIQKWISIGPWAPALLDPVEVQAGGDIWTLRYNAKGDEPDGFTVPTYGFQHSNEQTARKIAAVINKRLTTDLAVQATVVDGSEKSPSSQLTDLEIIGWHARGPWGVIAIDVKGDEVLPDDSAERQDDIVGYTLEWMWESPEHFVYNLEHETEAEAMKVAAEYNRKHAADRDDAHVIEASDVSAGEIESKDVDGLSNIEGVEGSSGEEPAAEEPKPDEPPKKEKKKRGPRKPKQK